MKQLTVKQLVLLRDAIITTGFIGTIIIVFIFQQIWSVLLLALFCCFWYYFQKRLTSKAMRRLWYIANDLMDPEMYEKEADSLPRLLSYRNHILKAVSDTTFLCMQGKFTEAAALFESLRVNKKGQAIYSNNLFYFYYRAGLVEKAAPLLSIAEKRVENKPGQSGLSSDMHNLGLYHLESKEYQSAREYLENALSVCSDTCTFFHLYYDLARLEEAQGNEKVAIAYFQKAAAIGPKTWMGQEAARRATTPASEGVPAAQSQTGMAD